MTNSDTLFRTHSRQIWRVCSGSEVNGTGRMVRQSSNVRSGSSLAVRDSRSDAAINLNDTGLSFLFWVLITDIWMQTSLIFTSSLVTDQCA